MQFKAYRLRQARDLFVPSLDIIKIYLSLQCSDLLTAVIKTLILNVPIIK